MRIYVTFSGKAYDQTTEIISHDAGKFGADMVRVYDDRWLLDTKPEFREINRWLFEPGVKPEQHGLTFGFGWCSWKPLVIMDMLKRCHSGDVVLYTDADTYPIADLAPIFEMCERDGIVLFESQGCPNDRFTRRDCMIAMGLDEPRYHGRNHACGRFQLFRAGYWPAEQLLCEWLAYSVNRMCQTVAPSRYGEDLPGYTRHSNEQSVLTMLAHKYDIPLHREACQFGWPPHGHPEDAYPQLFEQRYCQGDRRDVSGSRFRNA